MSTLSHNRGQERKHDPDQNTPQTLCPQRNREALVNTRQLAHNPHSVRTLAGLKTKIITDSCPSTIESWPTAGQPRHHFEIWSQTRIGIKTHSETWLALASDVLPWTNPRNPQTDGSQLLNALKKRREPTKIYKFKSTGKLPKHHSIVIVL